MQISRESRFKQRCAARAIGLRAAQRMMAQGVLGLSARLLRLAQAEDFLRITPEMTAVMQERRAMLRCLQMGIRSAAELSCIEAVSGAVADSDRGLLIIMQARAQALREA